MAKKYKVVTSGVAAEYVLSGLSHYLRQQGYEVVEIDFAYFFDDAKPLLEELSHENTIYITSAHANLTLSQLSILGSKVPHYYPNCLAPVEILPLLKPKLSIYIPHDLLAPYGDSYLEEIRFLDLFEHVLSTTLQDKQVLSAILPFGTQVHHAGWIKYMDKQCFTEDCEIDRLLFIAGAEHLRWKYGPEGFVEYLRPLLTKEVVVKFAAWDGVSKLEELVRQNTEAKVVSSSMNSIELIKRANIIMCNSLSSIHAESSLMGRPTICILDNEAETIEEQIQRLKHLPHMYFHNYSHKEPIPHVLFNELEKIQKETLLKPFDYNLVAQIIEQEMI